MDLGSVFSDIVKMVEPGGWSSPSSAKARFGGGTTAASSDPASGGGGGNVIAFDGLHTTDGKVISWQDIGFMSPEEKTYLFTHSAGMSTDQAKQLSDLLAKNKNIAWRDTSGGSDWNAAKTWVDPGYQQLSDELRVQKEAGMPATPTTNQIPSSLAVSPAALKSWTQNYAMPLMQQYNQQVQGDMSSLMHGIGAINAATKGASTNFTEPDPRILGMMQSEAGQAALANQMMGPTLNALTGVVGQNFQQEMLKEAAGAGMGTFLQYAGQSPAAQQILNQAGVGGLGSSSLINAIMAGQQQQPQQPVGTGG